MDKILMKRFWQVMFVDRTTGEVSTGNTFKTERGARKDAEFRRKHCRNMNLYLSVFTAVEPLGKTNQ